MGSYEREKLHPVQLNMLDQVFQSSAQPRAYRVLPSDPHQWQFHREVAAVAHDEAHSCNICISYLQHIRAAYQHANQWPSFQRAVADFATSCHHAHPSERGVSPQDEPARHELHESFLVPSFVFSEDAGYPSSPSGSFTITHNVNSAPSTETDLASPLSSLGTLQSVDGGSLQHNDQNKLSYADKVRFKASNRIKDLSKASTYPQITPSCKTTPRPTSGVNRRYPRTITELHALNNEAQKLENLSARLLMKRLSREAHNVASPEERTELQQEVLEIWRNPEKWKDPAQPPIKNPNLRNSSTKEWYEYLCVHHKTLQRGIRRDEKDYPLYEDVQAWLVCARLRPDSPRKSQKSPENVLNRKNFEAIFYKTLANGSYTHLVKAMGLPIKPTFSPQFYDGPFPASEFAIARHLADHGLSIETASRLLRPYCQRCLLAMDENANRALRSTD